MEFLMDYHIIFLMMAFILTLVSVLLLLTEDISIERAVGANVLILFNMVLNLIVSLGFGGIDVYGYDSNGALVHNVYSDMYPFVYVYWIFFYVNLMLLVYCVYIYYKHPWVEESEKKRNMWD